jgi:hypothetical protein
MTPDDGLRNTSRGRGWGASEGLWPCGHARTVENTASYAAQFPRCRACMRRLWRESASRKARA